MTPITRTRVADMDTGTDMLTNQTHTTPSRNISYQRTKSTLSQKKKK